MYSNVSNEMKIMDGTVRNKKSMFPFYLIIFYLFLEYIRPHGFVPFLAYLHLPAITIILILFSMLFSKYLYLKDKQTILFLILLSEMVIHGPIAFNNYWAFQMFYIMAGLFIVYLGIVNIVNTDFKYYRLINFWLIIFLFLSIIGITKKGVGMGGFLGDENDFCMTLNMGLPFALFGIFSAHKIFVKIFFIILICLMLSSILTYSRGGFIGLVAVTIYCWVISNKKIALATIIGFFIAFALFIAPPSYWERVQTITTESQNLETQSGTGSARVYSWKLGWHLFLNNPIIGVGQGNFPWRAGEAEDEKGVLWKTRSLKGRVAHSLYFTLLPELGLVGILIFVTMIICSLKDLKFIKKATKSSTDIFSKEEGKKIYYLALALEGGLVGFLASSVFISTFYYPNFWILCGFIVSLKKIVSAKCGDMNLAHPNPATIN